MKIVRESKRRQVCHFHLRNLYGAHPHYHSIQPFSISFITIFLAQSKMYNRKKISICSYYLTTLL